MMISLQAVRDDVTPGLRRLLAAARRPQLALEAGAKEVARALREHLVKLQARGNVKGWPERKFFHGGADSVSRRIGVVNRTATSVTVRIADPRFLHRITGGPVEAKRAKALAIPLTPQAYAMGGRGTLRESWPGLIPIRTKKGEWFLAERAAPRGPLTFHFVLKPSVTHRPHPEEQPDEAALAARAGRAMAAALTRAAQLGV